MTVLNEFLKIICIRADDNEDLHTILRDFLEPDTNDRKIHGGAVIRTVYIFFFNTITTHKITRIDVKQ